MITFEEASRVFDYCPETGVFKWKINTCKIVKAGNIAGGFSGSGYLRISYQGKRMFGHRLAWLLIYGEWPKNLIDHINGNVSDNRICNLREATQSQNQMNCGKRSHNTSGMKGVSLNKKSNRFFAWIRLDGKSKFMGSFATKEEASECAKASRMKFHGEFANHG